MQDLCRKNSDLTTTTGSCIAGTGSLWVSTNSNTQESTLLRNLSIKMTNPMEHCQNSQELGVHFQDQESSSTQSTGQSYHEAATASIEIKGCGKNVLSSGICLSTPTGSRGMVRKADEEQSKSVISFQDHGLPHSPIDYGQLACFPLPYPDPYHSGFAYGPFSVVHSQLLGLTAARVPLPLHPLHDEPIYVNAKQYRAILRRRQFRAKQEAQNKLSKVRKPYLHESRHRHALNRARGSGGRFLNTKKLQESNPSLKTNGQNISGSMQLQLNTRSMVSEGHKAENEKEGNSVSTCSDITIVSNLNHSLHPRGYMFSVYPSSRASGSLPNGGLGMFCGGGAEQYFSVLQ